MSENNSNFRLNGLNPLAYMGVNPRTPVPFFSRPQDPTSTDYANFILGTIWLNTANENIWMLVKKANFVSTWVQFSSGSSGTVISLTGNTGGAILPTAGNINTVGDGVGITIAGNPGTSTLTASLVGGGIAAQSFVTGSGTAVPNSAGVLNVLGGTGIATVGAGNTVAIGLTGAVATTFDGNTGSATPSGGILNIVGDGTTATTVASGNTITITAIGGGSGSNSSFFGSGGATAILLAGGSGTSWIPLYSGRLGVKADSQFSVPVAGTISNLYVNIGTSNTGANGTITINKNGVNTTVVATVTASTTGVFTDLVHSFTVVAGDSIQFEASDPTSGSALGTISAEFSSANGGGGSGALVLIQTQTAASVTSLPFTSGITSTYNNYLLLSDGFTGTPSGSGFALVQISINGGSSYIITGYGATIGSGLIIAQFTGGVGNYNGEAYLYNLTSGANYISVSGESSGFNGSTGALGTNSGTYLTPSTTVNALRIVLSDGSAFSGTFSLYGYTK